MQPNTAGRVCKDQALLDPTPDLGGFCAQTILLTMTGEIPVCDLMPGLRVITRDSGVAVIRTLQRRRFCGTAVTIKAGSLGHRRPPLDLIVPATSRILIRDWRAKALFGQDQALVAAGDLIDGEFVRAMPDQIMTITQIVFDSPHILYADGLEMACQTPRQD